YQESRWASVPCPSCPASLAAVIVVQTVPRETGSDLGQNSQEALISLLIRAGRRCRRRGHAPRLAPSGTAHLTIIHVARTERDSSSKPQSGVRPLLSARSSIRLRGQRFPSLPADETLRDFAG